MVDLAFIQTSSPKVRCRLTWWPNWTRIPTSIQPRHSNSTSNQINKNSHQNHTSLERRERTRSWPRRSMVCWGICFRMRSPWNLRRWGLTWPQGDTSKVYSTHRRLYRHTWLISIKARREMRVNPKETLLWTHHKCRAAKLSSSRNNSKKSPTSSSRSTEATRRSRNR
jgi:hypothetical protein